MPLIKSKELYKPINKVVHIGAIRKRHAQKAKAKFIELKLANEVPEFAMRWAREYEEAQIRKALGGTLFSAEGRALNREIVTRIDGVILKSLCRNKQELRWATTINNRHSIAIVAEHYAKQKKFHKEEFIRAMKIGISSCKAAGQIAQARRFEKGLADIESVPEGEARLAPDTARKMEKAFDTIGRLQTQAMYRLLGEERLAILHEAEDIFASQARKLMWTILGQKQRNNWFNN